MSVKWKMCKNCHHIVNENTDECPFCFNESFENDEGISDLVKCDIKELFEYCDLIDERGGYDESKTPILADFKSDNGNTVRGIVQMDLNEFLTYISVMGKSFSDEKSAFIKEYLNLSGDELNLENHDDFADYLPMSFKLFYENDRFHSDFLEEKNLRGYTSKLYEIYQTLGNLYLECDGSSSKKAYETYNSYIMSLGENLIRFKRDYPQGNFKNPKNQENVNNMIEMLSNCKSISEIDENSVTVAREWINRSISGDVEYDDFYDGLSRKRPDIVAELLISDSNIIHFNDEVLKKEPDTKKEESLEDLLDELNKLVGLEAVKKEVNSLINIVKIRKLRKERGMKQAPMSLHLVFSGNPGTGKTTVARLLSRIYAKLGVLSKGHLIETDRSGLVGGYLGQTAIKTQEVIQSAMGGILFIDEAYSLAPKRQDDAYGQEAIDTILKAMEDHRDDLVVIVAGYTDLMDNFIQSNPGLESRFNKYIHFEDYNPDELYGIFLSMCEDSSLKLDDKASEYLKGLCKDLYNSRGENFANARLIRNIFEKVLTAQANRLSEDLDITDDELMTIVLEDFMEDEI